MFKAVLVYLIVAAYYFGCMLAATYVIDVFLIMLFHKPWLTFSQASWIVFAGFGMAKLVEITNQSMPEALKELCPEISIKEGVSVSRHISAEAEARCRACEKIGIRDTRTNVFGKSITYNDGSECTDGVFGKSYCFSDGEQWLAGVHGYTHIKDGVRVEPTTEGSTVVHNSMVQMNGNRVIINGKDYTDKIPRGASVSIVNGIVYANGMLIE